MYQKVGAEMHIDHAFIKGRSHVVCQDYALTGMTYNLHYAIVADGCSMIRGNSGSTPHPYSDFSSRIVAFAAKEALYELRHHGDATALLRSDFTTLLRSKVLAIGNITGTTVVAGDSTLNIACHHNNIIMHLMIGDGVVVIETDEEWIIRERKFEPNFPYYVSYITLPERRDRYEMMGIKVFEHTYIIEKESGCMRSSVEEKTTQLTDSIEIYNGEVTRSITVMSDGIGDLRDTKQISTPEAVMMLLPFKSKEGPFIKRRLRAFERNLEKEGIVANDDISVAGIAL